MSKPIVIDLPIPHRALHPNARTHWAEKARHTKRHRENAYYAALSVKTNMRPWKSATVLIQFTFADKLRRDRDGLLSHCKAYFDGIADARVVENDYQFTFLPIEIMPPNKLKTGVQITVMEATT
jgi:crossover junction endodeoxyribonuclease RusA